METKRLQFWLNIEIPMWLNNYKTYKDFMKNFPAAMASIHFKMIAHAMACERWSVKLTDEEYNKIRW